MAFTYDLSTDLGLTRLTIGDTIEAAYVWEDAEITALLTRAGSVNAAAIALLRAEVASKARRIKRVSLQGLSLDDTAQVAALTEAIRHLGGDSPTFSAVMPALIEQDTGFIEPTA
jgi:ABC-type transporter Mla MlaB component